MEIKFKNITKSSRMLYNEFLKFHNKKYKKRDLRTVILLFSVVLYMIVFNIAYSNYSIAIFISIIALLFVIYNDRHQKNVVKKETNSPKIKNEIEIEYYFYNKYYFVIKVGKFKQKMRYYKVYRVNSDDKNFYLYTDKTHAFIVSKLGFTMGTARGFKSFIAKKCRFKYSELGFRRRISKSL